MIKFNSITTQRKWEGLCTVLKWINDVVYCIQFVGKLEVVHWNWIATVEADSEFTQRAVWRTYPIIMHDMKTVNEVKSANAIEDLKAREQSKRKLYSLLCR